MPFASIAHQHPDTTTCEILRPHTVLTSPWVSHIVGKQPLWAHLDEILSFLKISVNSHKAACLPENNYFLIFPTVIFSKLHSLPYCFPVPHFITHSTAGAFVVVLWGVCFLFVVVSSSREQSLNSGEGRICCS